MSYTTLGAVKTGLGISGITQDALLQQLMADAELYLNKALDITSFDTADITEKIKFNPQTYSQWGYYMFYLKNFNVTAIKEINGITYTGVLNTDYQIQNSRVLMIRNLHQYFTPTYFDYTTIKYTYGYVRTEGADVLPGDVELMTRLLVQGLYNERYPTGYNATTNGQPNMANVNRYSLGDEDISRAGKTISSIVSNMTPNDRGMFKQLFMKYKKTPNAIR